MKNKRGILLVIVINTIAVFIGIWAIKVTFFSKAQYVVPTPSSTPRSHGAAPENLSEDATFVINKRAELRQMLPFDSINFKIRYNYTTNKFVASIKTPSKENLVKFVEWLKINKFNVIPREEFRLTNYDLTLPDLNN